MKQINHTIVNNLLLSLSIFHKRLIYSKLKRYFSYLFIGFLVQVISGSLIFYFVELGAILRYTVLIIGVIVNASVVIIYVLLPVWRLGKVPQGKELAAELDLIKNDNVEIQDKLDNALFLMQQDSDNVLLQRDVENRLQFFDGFDFLLSIPPINWKKIGLIGLFSIGVYFLIGWKIPQIYNTAFERFSNPSIDYSTAGFSFYAGTNRMVVGKGESVNIKFSLVGTGLPESVDCFVNGVKSVVPVSNGEVKIYVESVLNELDVSLRFNNLISPHVVVDVYAEPMITVDSIVVKFPGYLNKEQRFYTQGVLNILTGSDVYYYSRIRNGGVLVNGRFLEGNFVVRDSIADAEVFEVVVKNSLGVLDSVVLQEYVLIKDQYPVISVNVLDSFVLVSVNDDYGLSSLKFSGNVGTKFFKVSGIRDELVIPIRDMLLLGDGQFTVCDNYFDNHCTVSELISLAVHKESELSTTDVEGLDQINSGNNLDEEKLEMLADQLRSIRKNINSSMRQMDKENEPSNRKEQIKEYNRDVLQPEIEELLDLIEKAKSELNSKELERLLDEIEENTDKVQDDLNESLLLLDELNKYEELKGFSDSLNLFLEKQNELLEKGKNIDSALLDMIDPLKDSGAELDEKLDSEEFSLEEDLKDIEKDLKESTGDNKKQEEGKKKTEELSNKIAQKLEMMDSGSAEDLDNLRNILEGLKLVSKLQEDCYTAAYNGSDDIIRDQQILSEGFQVIEDSLKSLAVRVPLIGNSIFTELESIETNSKVLMEEYSSGKNQTVFISQRKILVSQNELAVLLDDIVNSMQAQMSQSGKGACEKPGQGSPKPGSGKSSKAMKTLKKNMDALDKKISGKSKGKGSKGESTGSDEGSAKELSEMIIANQQLRNELRELLKDYKGSSVSNSLKELDELLEDQIEDLTKDGFTNESVMRQEDIKIKFLEAENAVRNQEWDNKREAQEGKSDTERADTELDRYLQEKLNELNLLRLGNLELNSYYKRF